jgi:hypothetical protein
LACRRVVRRPRHGGAAGLDRAAHRAIGDHPIDDVLAAVATVIPHENDAWLRAQAPSYIVIPEVLHALGIEGGFVFDDRSERALTPADASAQWVERPAPLPLYRENADLNYWYQYIDWSRTLYIKYNLCNEMTSQSFDAFGQQLFGVMRTRPIDRVVLDMRDNPGGASALLQPLITGVRAFRRSTGATAFSSSWDGARSRPPCSTRFSCGSRQTRRSSASRPEASRTRTARCSTSRSRIRA